MAITADHYSLKEGDEVFFLVRSSPYPIKPITVFAVVDEDKVLFEKITNGVIGTKISNIYMEENSAKQEVARIVNRYQ